jgi:hypothetical protein
MATTSTLLLLSFLSGAFQVWQLVLTLAVYAAPRLRNLEANLPDHA